MTQRECEDLLREHGVHVTANRITVMRALAGALGPLSLAEMGHAVVTIDKSGIYRTLTLFAQHHLVHVVEDGQGNAKYELCRSHSAGHDDDCHAHFYCERCGHTFCLADTPVPEVALPEGYVAHTTNYMIKGVCPRCRRVKS